MFKEAEISGIKLNINPIKSKNKLFRGRQKLF
jgi:hypothetical protein